LGSADGDGQEFRRIELCGAALRQLGIGGLGIGGLVRADRLDQCVHFQLRSTGLLRAGVSPADGAAMRNRTPEETALSFGPSQTIYIGLSAPAAKADRASGSVTEPRDK